MRVWKAVVTATTIFTAVPGEPVFSQSPAAGTVTDPRDRRVYPTVTLAGMTWMARNLNFATPTSFCYADTAALCDRYGRLYRWEEAVAACPVGWHLATDEEWQALELELGVPFRELLYRGPRGTDTEKKVLPGGSAKLEIELGGWREKDGMYRERDHVAAIWTSTNADMDHAWHRDIRPDRGGVFRSQVYMPYALSVRCVANRLMKDEPR